MMPSKSTIWQVVTRVDAAAVDAAVGLWLAARAGIDIAVDAGEQIGGDPAPVKAQPDGARTGEPSERQDGNQAGPPRAILAVDGKRVCGAKDADGNAPHLLAVRSFHRIPLIT